MKKETKTEQVMTRITITDRKKLNKLANKSGMTPSSYLCFLLRKAK